jgi:hypothetical protein
MEGLGYLKKSKIIENSLPSNEPEVKVKEEIPSNDIPNEELNISKFQEESKYIIEPSYVEKYNFITNDDILLK